MKSLNQGGQGLEVYIIFSDLFMLLFLCVSMLMGETLPGTYASEQSGLDAGQNGKVISLYVDATGAFFTDQSSGIKLKTAEVVSLLREQEIPQIVLHAPATLSLGMFSQLQTNLLQFGATEISYIPDGGHKNNE